MPKPMMMTIAVEEMAFGYVFRRLKNMEGVISLDLDGNADAKPNAIEPGGVPRYRGKGGGGIAKNGKGTDAAGTSAKCLVMSYIDAAGRPCPSVELSRHLVEHGKSVKTIANVTHNLSKNKQAKRTKRGWTLTAAGRKYLATECKIGEE